MANLHGLQLANLQEALLHAHMEPKWCNLKEDKGVVEEVVHSPLHLLLPGLILVHGQMHHH
jgi:hypothetical protein